MVQITMFYGKTHSKSPLSTIFQFAKCNSHHKRLKAQQHQNPGQAPKVPRSRRGLRHAFGDLHGGALRHRRVAGLHAGGLRQGAVAALGDAEAAELSLGEERRVQAWRWMVMN